MRQAKSALLPQKDVVYVNEQICQAGQYAEEALATLERQQVKEKAPGDFITETEIEIAQRLSRVLLSRFRPESHGVMVEDADHLPTDCRDPNAAHKQRVFVIDPLDGTDNYIKGDGQYCVMIGLLVDAQPVFGWIYAPARDTLYFGGPGYGIFHRRGQGKAEPLSLAASRPEGGAVRLIMGGRDPHREDVGEAFEKIEWVKMGSLGLKVVQIIEGHADLYLHMVRELKVWDTVAPVALALAAGLKACSTTGEHLRFDVEQTQHDQAILIGQANWVNYAISRLSNLEGKTLRDPSRS